MLQEFFRGFIKIHILHQAETGPVYGLEMAAQLKRHGYARVSPGTLYPALHSLERAGYLRMQRKQDAGRWRKFYVLTPKGRETLQQIRVKLDELADEVLARRALIGGTRGRSKAELPDSMVAQAAPQPLGDKPDQPVHGPIERDGRQPASTVPLERIGRKGERYWID